MKDLTQFIQESKESATFSLSPDDVDKILYSLAFAACWGDEVNNYEYPGWKKLFYELRDGAEKAFDSTKYKFPEKWKDFELSHRESARHLD